MFSSHSTTSTTRPARCPSAHAKTRSEAFMTNPIPTPTANAQPQTTKATGPRTAAGKQRSSMNAVTPGPPARSPVLATEDKAESQPHCRQFLDEYQPATATETQ